MENSLYCAAALIFTGVGAVWGVTAAAAKGRLPRNSWVGNRLATTKASDAAWLAGHRAALPLCRAAGIASVFVAMAMVADGLVSDNADGSLAFWGLFALGFGGLLVALFIAAIHADRAAKAITPES